MDCSNRYHTRSIANKSRKISFQSVNPNKGKVDLAVQDDEYWIELKQIQPNSTVIHVIRYPRCANALHFIWAVNVSSRYSKHSFHCCDINFEREHWAVSHFVNEISFHSFFSECCCVLPLFMLHCRVHFCLVIDRYYLAKRCI